jgi:hypothetical protein
MTYYIIHSFYLNPYFYFTPIYIFHTDRKKPGPMDQLHFTNIYALVVACT